MKLQRELWKCFVGACPRARPYLCTITRANARVGAYEILPIVKMRLHHYNQGMSRSIHLVVFAVFLFFSASAFALLIENKSEYPAVVELKDEKFNPVAKIRIEAKSEYEFLEKGREKDVFHIESYVEDPNDTLGIPTFLHLVKYKDKVCVPIDVCVKEKKKKKSFKLF